MSQLELRSQLGVQRGRREEAYATSIGLHDEPSAVCYWRDEQSGLRGVQKVLELRACEDRIMSSPKLIPSVRIFPPEAATPAETIMRELPSGCKVSPTARPR